LVKIDFKNTFKEFKDISKRAMSIQGANAVPYVEFLRNNTICKVRLYSFGAGFCKVRSQLYVSENSINFIEPLDDLHLIMRKYYLNNNKEPRLPFSSDKTIIVIDIEPERSDFGSVLKNVVDTFDKIKRSDTINLTVFVENYFEIDSLALPPPPPSKIELIEDEN